MAVLLKDPTKLITAADPRTVAEFGGSMIERDRTSRVLDLVATLVAEGKLDPHVRDVLSFDDAAQAIASVESGHALGKVVIEFS